MTLFIVFTNENAASFTIIKIRAFLSDHQKPVYKRRCPMKNSNPYCFEFRKIQFYFMIIICTPLLKCTPVTAINENNQPFF